MITRNWRKVLGKNYRVKYEVGRQYSVQSCFGSKSLGRVTLLEIINAGRYWLLIVEPVEKAYLCVCPGCEKGIDAGMY